MFKSVVMQSRARPAVETDHVTLDSAQRAFSPHRENPAVWAYAKTSHSWGAIYELVDDVWVVVVTIPKPRDEDARTLPNGDVLIETRPWRLTK